MGVIEVDHLESNEAPNGLKLDDIIEFIGPVDQSDPEDPETPQIGERGHIFDIHYIDGREHAVVSWEEWGTYVWGTEDLARHVRVVGTLRHDDDYLRKRDKG